MSGCKTATLSIFGVLGTFGYVKVFSLWTYPTFFVSMFLILFVTFYAAFSGKL